MRFLCVSDTHGVTPDGLPEGRFDAILHAGDVDNTRTLRRMERMARRRMFPLLYVRGNHDAGLADSEATIDLSGRAVRVADRLVVAGIGCALPGELLPTEEDIAGACAVTMASVRTIAQTGDRLILLSHYPPALSGSNAYSSRSGEVFSNSVGSVVRELMPLAVIHGHIHALQLHQEAWRGTLVACAGPDWGLLVIDVERGLATYCPWV